MPPKRKARRRNTRNSKIEVIPATISVPLLKRRAIRRTVLASRPTTVEQAVRDRELVSKEFRRRYESGDRGAVRRLLDVNPEFVTEPWVRRALEEIEHHPVEVRRGRGRPPGEDPDTAVFAMRLVVLVDRIHSQTGKSRDQIFEELAKTRFRHLSADGLSKRYYTAIHDPRITPMLFEKG